MAPGVSEVKVSEVRRGVIGGSLFLGRFRRL